MPTIISVLASAGYCMVASFASLLDHAVRAGRQQRLGHVRTEAAAEPVDEPAGAAASASALGRAVRKPEISAESTSQGSGADAGFSLDYLIRSRQ